MCVGAGFLEQGEGLEGGPGLVKGGQSAVKIDHFLKTSTTPFSDPVPSNLPSPLEMMTPRSIEKLT